jgi:hypothetical protein
MPLHPAPPGLPTMPNGSVDICALITPQTTTKQRTRAGRLAKRISRWASHALTNDGQQYEAQSADGIVRAFPFPPGQMPRWHGPANIRQPVNSVPMGQARAAPTLPALSLANSLQMTHLHTLPPPPPPQQVDVFFALAKGNWHCGNPRCCKPLDAWAAPGADNAMCIARGENYIYHDGPRHLS